jgi:hypothetical protein
MAREGETLCSDATANRRRIATTFEEFFLVIMVVGMAKPVGSVKLSRALAVIGCGGLLAGILHGVDAVVSVWLRGIPISRLFQLIASGLLGSSAFKGGSVAAVPGGCLHFFIATGVTFIYT